MTDREPALTAAARLIRSRRSIKPADMDADRPVDRALLMELLENANWAPTHGLTEPWRFRVFSGPARRTLAGEMQRIYQEVTPSQNFRADKLEKLGRNPLLAPVVVVVWMERRGGEKIPEIEEIEATACAIHNLTLGATACGLGSFWSTPPLIYSRAFGEWLGIRPEDRCVGVVYLGWLRAGFVWPDSARRPVADKISWADA